MKEKNKHLTLTHRQQIEALLLAGVSKSEISGIIGCCLKTLYNEIRRGTTTIYGEDFKPVTRYFADCGHSVYLRREAEKGVSCRMHDLEWWAYIEHKIMHEKYSPRAVLYRIKYELHTDDIVSPSTLYSYIHKGYFPHLRMRHCPARIPYRKRTHKRLIKRTYGRSIEQRNISREEIGHWEMDTVVGRREKGPCLLVLTERHTRFEIIRKIEGRTQNAVQKALNDLEREYSGNFSSIFKSITMDNGKEFLNQAMVEESCRRHSTTRKLFRTIAYYCHPYSSWERGSNENSNRLIRRFVPKGHSIAPYTTKKIRTIQDWMNNYPRTILGGLSAKEVCMKVFQAIL